MPGIVPLGNLEQQPTPSYSPALGTRLKSCAPSYQALLASVPAGSRPGTCLSMEKFLQLTARLTGCGGSPPKDVSVEKVMRLGLCTILTHTFLSRIWSACPPVGCLVVLGLLLVWLLASFRPPDSRYHYECLAYWGFILTPLPCRTRSPLLSPVWQRDPVGPGVPVPVVMDALAAQPLPSD